MVCFDVFNGDADGICALVQLRLHQPQTTQLITGIKRDIALLQQVDAVAGDEVTVLDISMAKNIDALNRLLQAGVNVRYFDHHQAGTIPNHPNLSAHIDTSSDVCSSLLVDSYLQGAYRQWAIVAAFGDGLQHSAEQAASSESLSSEQLLLLRQFGEYINYNGYGTCVEELHFAPADLFQQLVQFKSPLQCITERQDLFQKLEDGYKSDMSLAEQLSAEHVTAHSCVYFLPDEAWAHRVSGVFGNSVMHANPELAHAIITVKQGGGYLVSIRAPLTTRTGADTLCSQFATGGGRQGAAGINHLPEEELSNFIARFSNHFQ